MTRTNLSRIRSHKSGQRLHCANFMHMEYMTDEEVQAHTGLSRAAILNRVRQGRLNPVKSAYDNRRNLFPRKEVEALNDRIPAA